MVLLDTNAYTSYKLAHPEVMNLVRSADEVLMSTIVLGEILFGARLGNRFQRNLTELMDFLGEANVRVLPIGLRTAELYGSIAAALRTIGRPIPTNDIWIAAHAIESGAELVSADRHFGHVEGLAWVSVPSGQA